MWDGHCFALSVNIAVHYAAFFYPFYACLLRCVSSLADVYQPFHIGSEPLLNQTQPSMHDT